MKRIRLPTIDPERATMEISDYVVTHLKTLGKNGAVVGLSGGVDSTTVAAILKRGFDDYNTKNDEELELVGYILPTNTNKNGDTEDGVQVAKRLGIRYEVHDLEPIVDAYHHTNPEAFESKFEKGNLQSRIRANVLNTKAATEGKSVAGTGNKDEDYGIGYYTLYGDGAVHMSPIGNLSKRLVRELASYLGFGDLANKSPSAGLEEGQTDFKDLGYRYILVELVTEGLDQGFSLSELATHDQVRGPAERQIDDYQRQYGKARFESVDELVNDIVHRHENIALPKARLLSPEAAPVTMEYR